MTEGGRGGAERPMQGIASMATRRLLAEAAKAWSATGGRPVAFTSVGGVDAECRVAAGEPFDVVVLAKEALQRLVATGTVRPSGHVEVARSDAAAAVRRGSARPVLDSVAALRATVTACRRVGYSTGPSGVALIRLFSGWGLATDDPTRFVQARPGHPVGAMVASGEVDLGFQQFAELIDIQGIDVVSPLPPELGLETTFAGGVVSSCDDPETAHALLAFLATPALDDLKRGLGLAPGARSDPAGTQTTNHR